MKELMHKLVSPLRSWEGVLLLLIVLGCLVNAWLSPYFFELNTLSDATYNFTEKALVALPLALLIIAGEIDVSMAGTMALASVMMGLAAEAGVGTPGLVVIGLATGCAAGAVNGALVAGLEVPAIVATIGTMSLFRGTAYAILGDRAIKTYPDSFDVFGQGYAWGLLSWEMALFIVAAALFWLLLHRSVAGRRIYAIGANPVAARMSGIAIRRARFWLFVAVGAAAGLASILLTSRLGSTRPSIAQGWELEIISLVILGGVSVSGGKGSMTGVVLACLLMGLVTFGLGLLNVPGIVMSIGIGGLLIAVVALPTLVGRLAGRHRRQTSLKGL